MLFNSLAFLVFFICVVALNYLVPHRYRWLILLLASVVFYLWSVPMYAGILALNILLDYICGMCMEAHTGRYRKFWLALSLGFNGGTLVFFKCYNLSVVHLNQLFFHGCDTHSYFFTQVLLPLGLSFHTLQAMSYAIEVYRGNQKAERHLGIYALYVMFFPKLAMGPIERPMNLLPQLRQRHDFCFDDVLLGLKLMAWGLFKKVVIADRLALTVNRVYESPQNYNGTVLWVAVVFYAFQIYCDFSGYTDIAIGAARVLGIRLSPNFDQPFKSRSVSEFWRRWHISFSSWLRDYLFVPLSLRLRNQGRVGIAMAVIITFCVSGLWHGPLGTFLVWGLLHGLVIVAEFLTQDHRAVWFRNVPARMMDSLGRLYTFVFLCLTWVLFRATDLGSAWYIFSHLFHGWGRLVAPLYLRAMMHNVGYENWIYGVYNLVVGFLLITLVLYKQSRLPGKSVSGYEEVSREHWFKFYLALVLIMIAGVYEVPEFIYLNF